MHGAKTTKNQTTWYALLDSFTIRLYHCGSPPGVMMADTLSFNAKIGVVDF